jgi:hypothetical protein
MMTARHIATASRYAITTLIALVLVASGFADLRALAQTPTTGIPAAPAGGINASKLPDVEGLHLGMTVDQAIAVMKPLFPVNYQTLYSHYDKGPTWVSSLRGTSTDNSDYLEVYFSMPPNPQQVVSIHRTLNLPAGKQPTMDATVASLRQKYGKELASTKSGVGVMAWAYDEQGQPANPQGPSNWNPGDCAGQSYGVTGGEPPPGQGLEVDYVLGPVPLAQQLPALTGNLCSRNVYVTARVGQGAIQGVAVVQGIFMYLGEEPLMLRNAVAGQQYLDGLAAAKQQQQQKNSQQQKAPAL